MKTILKLIIISTVFGISFVNYSSKLKSISPLYITKLEDSSTINANQSDLVIFTKNFGELNNNPVIYKSPLTSHIEVGVAIKEDSEHVILLREDNTFLTLDNSIVRGKYFGVLPAMGFLFSIFNYPILILLLLVPGVLYIYYEINSVYSEMLKLTANIAPLILFKYYRIRYKVLSMISKKFNREVRFHHGK